MPLPRTVSVILAALVRSTARDDIVISFEPGGMMC
jgi:hypothetical protein